MEQITILVPAIQLHQVHQLLVVKQWISTRAKHEVWIKSTIALDAVAPGCDRADKPIDGQFRKSGQRARRSRFAVAHQLIVLVMKAVVSKRRIDLEVLGAKWRLGCDQWSGWIGDYFQCGLEPEWF